MIDLHSLSKSFGPTPALAPTTLSVAAGEVFVLLGPSGSGKSTLLRLIAGLEAPTGGRIVLNGQDVTDWPPHKRNVALVSQRPALAALTVEQNLAQGLRFAQSRLARRERLPDADIAGRVREAAEILELTPLLTRPAGDLSGGEQQRVALGRAVVRRAPVWLLDEPFGSLDTALAEKLSRSLILLRDRFALTIVFVTHNPNEAMSLADRVGVLGGGHSLQAGTPAEVHDRPGHRAVAFHFGRPTINLIAGSVRSGTFSTTSGSLTLPTSLPAGDVCLGLRPDDLSLEPGTGRLALGAFALQDKRRWGAGWLATVEAGGDSLRVLTAAEPPTVGGPTTVWADREKMHWFAADTGRRLD